MKWVTAITLGEVFWRSKRISVAPARFIRILELQVLCQFEKAQAAGRTQSNLSCKTGLFLFFRNLFGLFGLCKLGQCYTLAQFWQL